MPSIQELAEFVIYYKNRNAIHISFSKSQSPIPIAFKVLFVIGRTTLILRSLIHLLIELLTQCIICSENGTALSILSYFQKGQSNIIIKLK